MFLDSHCHLTAEEFAPQLEEVLLRARAQHVTTLINIGDGVASSRAALAQIPIAQQHGIVQYATVGVHPQRALEFSFDQTPHELRELAAPEGVCAIGEIGLDYLYDETHPVYPGATRAVQEKVLCAQLELACELDLPVVIHNREADARLLEIMRDWSRRGVRGVFHCFGSPLEVAREVLNLGFYLGFTGLITFKNAESVREVARFCPLDRLLIETDAPYLAPVPFRGKTNEPSYLPQVAATLATLHQCSREKIAQLTTQNAMRLFALRES